MKQLIIRAAIIASAIVALAAATGNLYYAFILFSLCCIAGPIMILTAARKPAPVAIEVEDDEEPDPKGKIINFVR